MALEKMTENVEIVQTLSTYPNQEDGLSAEELKAKFDAGSKAIKEYLNGKVVPAVQELERVVDPGMAYGLDTTLTVAGRAADAGAVGTALAGKAPAGYGLGVESKLLTSADDLNNIKANGWYMWYTNNAPANFPAEYAWREFQACRVWTLDGGVCLQEIVDMGYNPQVAGVRVQRTIYGTEYIGEWEVENPPMFVGVEYRTTMRLNGKPVYAYMYNWGALPAAASTVKSVGISNVDKLLHVIVASAPWSFPSAYSNIANSVLAYVLNASTIQIRITTATDESASTAFVVLAYTKTTD